LAERTFDMAVAAATDANYAWPSVLALMSAGAQSTTSTVCVLIGDELRPDFVAAAENAFANFSIPFKFVEADFTEFSSLPLGFHFSRAAYGRLRVAEAAVRFAPRTLYLDADTLTIGDIAPLAALNFGEKHAAAAVRSRLLPRLISEDVPGWAQRRVDPAAPFFNSGVLLIDNDLWTRRDISAQVVADLRRRPDTATFADQGTLNKVLEDQWLELPWSWNYEIAPTPTERVGPLAVSRRSCFSFRAARILHYFGDVKPWDCRYPPGYLSRLYRRNWEHFFRPTSRGSRGTGRGCEPAARRNWPLARARREVALLAAPRADNLDVVEPGGARAVEPECHVSSTKNNIGRF
jgi:lipopolysaccharide biosynthesis glycosyltransferase